jgi:hypothetical protein
MGHDQHVELDIHRSSYILWLTWFHRRDRDLYKRVQMRRGDHVLSFFAESYLLS